MSKGAVAELRIYCICGQKMKVSESMFGLPGKCVACRQKIRVPRPDQLPDDTAEVYLKDHPEFLRKSRRHKGGDGRGKAVPKPENEIQAEVSTEEPEGLPLGDVREAPAVPSLDILEPLRVLCSLEHKVQRQLGGQEDSSSNMTAADRVALEGFLDRVRRSRTELDEELRQRLMEVAIEISSTQEKIIQTGLSARIGEIEFGAHYQTVDALRRRRDELEREQQNLRGWLSVSDPHAAGGYSNVSLDSLPDEGFDLEWPHVVPDPRPLLDQHVEGLREAFLRRERAEKRLQETEKLKSEGRMSLLALQDALADSEAERKRAEAEVTYRRKRLEDLITDATGDIQTAQVCLEYWRKRFNSNEIDKHRFATAENELLTAQRDAARVHDIVSKALVASAAPDVPALKGTFLKRLARALPAETPKEDSSVDLWLAWLSALFMGLSVLLPLVDDLPLFAAFQNAGLRGQAIHWVMIAPVAAGLIVALATMLPNRQSRGLAFTGFWLLLTVVGSVIFHEAGYGMGTLAVRFREGTNWLIRPGVIMLFGANGALLGAACAALWRIPNMRRILVGIITFSFVASIMLFTDFGGYFAPRPKMSAAWTSSNATDKALYDTAVTIQNAGGRRLILASAEATNRNAFHFVFERNSGDDSWIPVGAPKTIDSNAGVVALPGPEVRNVVVPARDALVMRYDLAPGSYRLRLFQNAAMKDVATQSFVLEAPPESHITAIVPPVPDEPQPPSEERPASASTPSEASTPSTPTTSSALDTSATGEATTEEAVPRREPIVLETPGLDVELRGIVNPPQRGPRFLVVLYLPDGTTRNLNPEIGDSIYGSWIVSEFNSLRQTVTLANGDDIIVLNRGQRIPLSRTTFTQSPGK